MDAKRPIKNKKYKLIVYHQDGKLWVKIAHALVDSNGKVPLSLLLQASGWSSSRVDKPGGGGTRF